MNWRRIYRVIKRSKKERPKDIIPLYLQYAIKEIGVKEIPGEEENPRINEYHAVCNIKGEDRGWCSSFLCWCMEQAGLKHTSSALARSWLEWGDYVEKPQVGDIVIFKRGTEPWMGHTAIYMGKRGNLINVLGGNQTDMVCVSRYPEKKLLGYRRVSII